MGSGDQGQAKVILDLTSDATRSQPGSGVHCSWGRFEVENEYVI